MRHLDPDHPSSKHILQPNDQIDDTDAYSGPSTHQVKHLINDEIDTDFQMEEEGRSPFYPRRFDGDKPATELDGPREHVNQDQEELDFASTLLKDITKGINNPRVSVVVAVEYDLSHERQDVRTGYTRDLQIVQWTMMVSFVRCGWLRVVARGQWCDRWSKRGGDLGGGIGGTAGRQCGEIWT